MRGNRHKANHKQGIRRVAEIQSGESKGPRPAAGYCPIHLRGQRRECALTYKISRSKRYNACSDVVEMGGVEPPSESTLTGTSPSAYGQLHSLPCAPAVRLAESVASLCVVRSKLCVLTGTTDRRSVPGRGPPGGNAR